MGWPSPRYLLSSSLQKEFAYSCSRAFTVRFLHSSFFFLFLLKFFFPWDRHIQMELLCQFILHFFLIIVYICIYETFYYEKFQTYRKIKSSKINTQRPTTQILNCYHFPKFVLSYCFLKYFTVNHRHQLNFFNMHLWTMRTFSCRHIHYHTWQY